MKNLLLSITTLLATSISFAQVGIGVTTPHASAALEVKANSNDKGVLIPRLTQSERDAISSPAVSLIIYQSDNNPGFYYYSGTGWIAVGDNLGNHLLTQSLDLNGEAITDNIGNIKLVSANGNDIILESANDIILDADKMIIKEDTEVEIEEDVEFLAEDDFYVYAESDITLTADETLLLEGDNVSIVAYNDLKIKSRDDLKLEVASGHFVEIHENNSLLYKLPNDRGNIGQFLQRSSDGSSEFFSDWSNYTLPLADGTSGQVLTTNGAGEVSWATPGTSDRRLKTNIQELSQGINTVMQLNPVSYSKRLNFDTENYYKNEFGFIAQEVREFLPELVKEGRDENKTLSLDYNSFIPILAKAIQEQQAVIDSLLKRIETLEAKN